MYKLNQLGISAMVAASCLLAPGNLLAQTAGHDDVRALTPPSVVERGLVVGSSLTYPPMYYFLEDGVTMRGMIIEIATEVANRLGAPMKVSQMSLSSQIAAIKSGKIDVIPFFTDTEKRREDYLIVDFMTNSTAFLVLKGNPLGIETYSDLCGHAVGTSRGTPQVLQSQTESAKCVEAGKEEITIKQYPDTTAGEAALRTKKIDAYLASPPGAAYAAKIIGDGTIFDAVMGGGYSKPLGFGVIKTNDALAKAIAAAFDTMLKDGALLKIMTAYGMQDTILDAVTINGESR